MVQFNHLKNSKICEKYCSGCHMFLEHSADKTNNFDILHRRNSTFFVAKNSTKDLHTMAQPYQGFW